MSQQSLDVNLLGCTCYNSYRLLPRKIKINSEYKANLTDRFSDYLKKERPHLADKKVLFQQDNARVHTSVVVMAKFKEWVTNLLPHSPYYPVLALTDYFVFPNWKKWLDRDRLESSFEFISQINANFGNSTILFIWTAWTNWRNIGEVYEAQRRNNTFCGKTCFSFKKPQTNWPSFVT